jgi:hypothetical protein
VAAVDAVHVEVGAENVTGGLEFPEHLAVQKVEHFFIADFDGAAVNLGEETLGFVEVNEHVAEGAELGFVHVAGLAVLRHGGGLRASEPE